MARKVERPRGSEMSSKQLARTVVHGRKVTFRFPTGDPISGYLGGMDDFHWLVVAPESGLKHLIHKGSACIITLADTHTYESEPLRDQMEKVIGPFRRYVEEVFFGRTSPASVERAVAV
jgi:hypothetical protein